LISGTSIDTIDRSRYETILRRKVMARVHQASKFAPGTEAEVNEAGASRDADDILVSSVFLFFKTRRRLGEQIW
jgi:hypothetical protein